MNPGNAGEVQHGGWQGGGAYRAWWTQENGRAFTDSLNVAFNLHEVTPNAGGLVIVPGSCVVNCLLSSYMYGATFSKPCHLPTCTSYGTNYPRALT